jgi:hypothetical protein
MADTIRIPPSVLQRIDFRLPIRHGNGAHTLLYSDIENYAPEDYPAFDCEGVQISALNQFVNAAFEDKVALLGLGKERYDFQVLRGTPIAVWPRRDPEDNNEAGLEDFPSLCYKTLDPVWMMLPFIKKHSGAGAVREDTMGSMRIGAFLLHIQSVLPFFDQIGTCQYGEALHNDNEHVPPCWNCGRW